MIVAKSYEARIGDKVYKNGKVIENGVSRPMNNKDQKQLEELENNFSK